MNKRRLFAPIFSALLLLLLAACSSGASSSNEIKVTAGDDFQFSPATITVKAGQEIQLTFENGSSIEHSFNVLKLGEELEHVLEEAHDEEALHEELVFEMHEQAPGASETETFMVPSEPGDYVFFCSVPGHAEAGLVGTLKVTS